MDDITTLFQTVACTPRLLQKLEELLTWIQMKKKTIKSCTLSIWKRIRGDNISFSVIGKKIWLLVHQHM